MLPEVVLALPNAVLALPNAVLALPDVVPLLPDITVLGPYTYLATEVVFGAAALALLVRAGAVARAAKTIAVLYPVAYVWDWYTLEVGVFAIVERTGVELLAIPIEEHLFIVVVPSLVVGVHETLHGGTEAADSEAEAANSEAEAADSKSVGADSEAEAADSKSVAADSELEAANSESVAADSGSEAADSKSVGADSESE